jgi:AcrR family transcriptional regulator
LEANLSEEPRWPRGTRAASPQGLPLPVENPVSNLHPTAQAIIATAQQIIADEGLHRLTLRRIAESANVNVSAVKYHFGSKAGLLAVVLDASIHDDAIAMVAATLSLTGEERLHAYIDGVLSMVNNTRAFRSFFELVPAILRSPALRKTAIDLYNWYLEWTSMCLGLDAITQNPETTKAIAQLLVATSDGLALQRLLDEEGLPAEGPHVILERLLWSVLHGDIRVTSV